MQAKHFTHVMGLKTLLIGIVLLAAFGCRQPKIPEYQAFENFSIGKIGLTEAVVSADLKYYNPNTYPLEFSRADLDIALNERSVGKTVLDSLIKIPALDTFYLPVQLRLNTKQIFSNALSLLLNNEIDVKVTGTVRMGRSGIFFNMPVNYQGKQKLEW